MMYHCIKRALSRRKDNFKERVYREQIDQLVGSACDHAVIAMPFALRSDGNPTVGSARAGIIGGRRRGVSQSSGYGRTAAQHGCHAVRLPRSCPMRADYPKCHRASLSWHCSFRSEQLCRRNHPDNGGRAYPCKRTFGQSQIAQSCRSILTLSYACNTLTRTC
jgi:hypothetical protein